MNWFTIGAVIGYLLICFVNGKLLPVFSLPTILSVVIGGTIGQFLLPPLLAAILGTQSGDGGDTRGYQPKPGERTMTKEEWKAKQREERLQRKNPE